MSTEISQIGTTPLLEVNNLRKYFPIRKGFLQREVGNVRAVDDVSFFINENETLGLVVAPDPGWMVMGGERMSMSPVYLAAYQWGYTPAAIQLEAGVEYQFNMMALDVYHGASINTDSGSLMIRLTPGFVLETRLTFDEPGTYTLYCTYYCGKDHNSMSGSIVVV